nr:MAG TPA: hypothetical protein [Caudoviricetes sp.]DAR22189.1 MAG TPA: hypothetical protein [Caudoviricetes sp.]DAX47773.1 MAG TPA: hypothetical protein [Caudoviricetes sp.]
MLNKISRKFISEPIYINLLRRKYFSLIRQYKSKRFTTKTIGVFERKSEYGVEDLYQREYVAGGVSMECRRSRNGIL